MADSDISLLIQRGGWPQSAAFDPGGDEPTSVQQQLVIPHIRLDITQKIYFFGSKPHEHGSVLDPSIAAILQTEAASDLEVIYHFVSSKEKILESAALALFDLAEKHLPSDLDLMHTKDHLHAVYIWLTCSKGASLTEDQAEKLFRGVKALLKNPSNFSLGLDIMCELLHSADTELRNPGKSLQDEVKRWLTETAVSLASGDVVAEIIAIRILSYGSTVASRFLKQAFTLNKFPEMLERSLSPPPPPSSKQPSQSVSKLRLQLNRPSASPSVRSELVVLCLLWLMEKDGHLNLSKLSISLQDKLWQAMNSIQYLSSLPREWGSSERIQLVFAFVNASQSATEGEVHRERKLTRVGGGTHGHVYAIDSHQVAKVVESKDLHSLGRALKELTVLMSLRGIQGVVQLLSYQVKQQCEVWMCFAQARSSLLDYRQSLGQKLKENDLVHLLRLFHEIAKALYVLFTHLVLHNDLRCCNCLVTEGGHILIADFGEAAVLSNMDSRLYESRGTETIQSPEMLRVCSQEEAKEKLVDFDRRRNYTVGFSFPSDVWALGCLLFELVTGGEELYDEARHSWPQFFVRLVQEENNVASSSHMDVIPEDRSSLIRASCEQNAYPLCSQVEALLRYVLKRDERIRPTALAIAQRVHELSIQKQCEESADMPSASAPPFPIVLTKDIQSIVHVKV